jgi:hypothetical protein
LAGAVAVGEPFLPEALSQSFGGKGTYRRILLLIVDFALCVRFVLHFWSRSVRHITERPEFESGRV